MIALSHEGEVFSFGSNSAGQLGLGHLTNVGTAERVPINASKDAASTDRVSKDTVSIKSIAVGATHALALCSQGNVYAWGSNQ